MLPAVLAVLPGLVAGFADARDRKGAPRLLTGIEVGRVDPAADAEFAAGRPDDGKITYDQRRERHSFAKRRLRRLALPCEFAGCAVDRENAPVERDRDHLVLPQGDAAVVDATARHIASPHAIDAGI